MNDMRRLATLVALVCLVGACALAATAGGDEFSADPDVVNTTPSATVPVNVTLVAIIDNVGERKSGHTCNLENEQNPQGHFVEASVTSSNTAVATVSPDTLNYTACDETLQITITAVAGGTATITISAEDWVAKGGPNAVFSDETIQVTVAGDCGGQPPVTGCAKPAAPAWAAAILKANGIKPKQTDNLISLVAQHMEQGATFDGIAKSEQGAYAQAVYEFLDAHTNLPLPIGPAGAAKPGWVCTTGTV
jgi:hypothetical protein